jgi:hypothetical protein
MTVRIFASLDRAHLRSPTTPREKFPNVKEMFALWTHNRFRAEEEKLDEEGRFLEERLPELLDLEDNGSFEEPSTESNYEKSTSAL